MARGCGIGVCLLASLAVPVKSQASTQTQDARAHIMRKQPGDSQVLLGPAGELQLREVTPHKPTKDTERTSSAAQAWLKMTQGGAKVSQPGEKAWCATAYPLGKENSNECNHGQAKVRREEDCKHAAGVLGLAVGSPNFNVKDDWVNPNPYAKDCFVVNKTVFFNPTESTRASGWKGTPICQWAIYTNGTAESDSSSGCTGDYEEITSYKECEWAHDCEYGGMFCQEPEFANDHYQTNDAPRGCYRSKIGCYGFNARATAPTGDLKGKTPVCRLKKYKFKGHEPM